MKVISTIISAIVLASLCEGHKNPYQWDNRNTIVHLFEWKWTDIADECERFLQYNGYGGVQLSPVTENVVVEKRPWWERYQPISYKFDTRSGNESEFGDMVKRCNAVGVRTYVDIIINHMTGPGSHLIGTGGSVANADIKYYPSVPFNATDFHETCSAHHGTDEDERNCELVGLKDLDQSVPNVREKIIEMLNKMIDAGVAGFRIDAAKHMAIVDLDYIYRTIHDLNVESGFPPGARPYIYQEVIDMNGHGITREEYTPLAPVTEFRYGAYLGKTFRGHDHHMLANLRNWGPEWGLIEQSEDALVFIDNHDNQRGHGNGGSTILTYKDGKRYRMAVAFMLAHPYGTTRVMSSYDFQDGFQGPPQDLHENILSPQTTSDEVCAHGWVCEHRWRQISNMVGFRNAVKNTIITNWWSNGKDQIAFGREDKGFVAFTNKGDINKTLQTSMPSGVYCDVISGSLVNGKCTGKTYVVDVNNQVVLKLRYEEEDGVVALHINAKL